MRTKAADRSAVRLEATMVWWCRAVIVAVLGNAALNWVGWATGRSALTRVVASWPQMTPWTAALLAILAVGILVQSGRPTRARNWLGFGLAVVAGAIAVTFLAEYAIGGSFGLDQLWFPESVRHLQASWPGRPSPQTASNVLLLSIAVGLTRLDRRWTPAAWMASLLAAAVLPMVIVVAYLYHALSLVGVTRSTGMGILTAIDIVLLVTAVLAVRPDRNPVAWLLSRPDRRTLMRMVGLLAGPPILIGVARLALLHSGVQPNAAWVLSIALSTVIVGGGTFYLSQHEQKRLIEKERERAVAEERFRLLADNAGDVVTHFRDGKFVWVSPSAEGLLGAPADYWVGRQAGEMIPPEDLSTITAAVAQLGADDVIRQRIRVTSHGGVTHWVDVYARPFHDSSGHRDGATASMRVIDDEVAAEETARKADRRRAKAEERYRRSMDNAPIGMCLITLDGHFEEVNGALCELFGYDAETLMQKSWQQLTAPDYLEVDLQNVEDIVAGRQDSYRMIKQYIHASGDPIWGDLSVSCIRDEDGRVEQFISQITDITAAVEASERNRILAQRLQQQTDRMTAELQSAAKYMDSIMPTGLTGEVSASSRYIPSRELGGDCFYYTWVDPDHLLVYLIDVSGHGIEPALLSVSLHNMLRSGSVAMETLLAPDKMLVELNRRFQMSDQAEHFFTVWFGVYRASTRTMRYANAGAPPALAYDPRTGVMTELSTNSPPAGLFDDTVFPVHVYQVPHDCQILLYSDGAFELPLPGDRQFSLPEFKHLAARLAESPNGCLDDFVDTLQAMIPDGFFEDDCSLIQLRFD